MNTMLTQDGHQTDGAVDLDFGRPLRAGAFALALAFGGFGTWAMTAPLDSAVIAPGVVKFEHHRKVVQHRSGGIVDQIRVKEGDLVQAGDLLVRLDDTETRAQAQSLHLAVDNALAREALLASELRDLDEPALDESQLARIAEDPRVHELLADTRLEYQARRQSRDGRINAIEQRIVQLEREAIGLAQQRRGWERQLDLQQRELVELEALEKQGYYPRNQILAMQREAARLEAEIGTSLADEARVQKEASAARLEIVQLRQDTREAALAELRTVREELRATRERLAVAEAELQRTEIRAPTAGVVQGLNLHTVGGVVKPGESLMDIVPVGDALLVEARIAPVDIDSIGSGAAAEIRFAAFNSRQTPLLNGRVMAVSPDRFIDSQTGSAYYLARVSVGDDELALLGDQQVQAGMPAEVFIKTGERTFARYLWEPLGVAFNRAFREE